MADQDNQEVITLSSDDESKPKVIRKSPKTQIHKRNSVTSYNKSMQQRTLSKTLQSADVSLTPKIVSVSKQPLALQSRTGNGVSPVNKHQLLSQNRLAFNHNGMTVSSKSTSYTPHKQYVKQVHLPNTKHLSQQQVRLHHSSNSLSQNLQIKKQTYVLNHIKSNAPSAATTKSNSVSAMSRTLPFSTNTTVKSNSNSISFDGKKIISKNNLSPSVLNSLKKHGITVSSLQKNDISVSSVDESSKASSHSPDQQLASQGYLKSVKQSLMKSNTNIKAVPDDKHASSSVNNFVKSNSLCQASIKFGKRKIISPDATRSNKLLCVRQSSSSSGTVSFKNSSELKIAPVQKAVGCTKSIKSIYEKSTIPSHHNSQYRSVNNIEKNRATVASPLLEQPKVISTAANSLPLTPKSLTVTPTENSKNQFRRENVSQFPSSQKNSFLQTSGHSTFKNRQSVGSNSNSTSRSNVSPFLNSSLSVTVVNPAKKLELNKVINKPTTPIQVVEKDFSSKITSKKLSVVAIPPAKNACKSIDVTKDREALLSALALSKPDDKLCSRKKSKPSSNKTPIVISLDCEDDTSVSEMNSKSSSTVTKTTVSDIVTPDVNYKLTLPAPDKIDPSIPQSNNKVSMPVAKETMKDFSVSEVNKKMSLPVTKEIVKNPSIPEINNKLSLPVDPSVAEVNKKLSLPVTEETIKDSSLSEINNKLSLPVAKETTKDPSVSEVNQKLSLPVAKETVNKPSVSEVSNILGFRMEEGAIKLKDVPEVIRSWPKLTILLERINAFEEYIKTGVLFNKGAEMANLSKLNETAADNTTQHNGKIPENAVSVDSNDIKLQENRLKKGIVTTNQSSISKSAVSFKQVILGDNSLKHLINSLNDTKTFNKKMLEEKVDPKKELSTTVLQKKVVSEFSVENLKDKSALSKQIFISSNSCEKQSQSTKNNSSVFPSVVPLLNSSLSITVVNSAKTTELDKTSSESNVSASMVKKKSSEPSVSKDLLIDAVQPSKIACKNIDVTSDRKALLNILDSCKTTEKFDLKKLKIDSNVSVTIPQNLKKKISGCDLNNKSGASIKEAIIHKDIKETVNSLSKSVVQLETDYLTGKYNKAQTKTNLVPNLSITENISSKGGTSLKKKKSEKFICIDSFSVDSDDSQLENLNDAIEPDDLSPDSKSTINTPAPVGKTNLMSVSSKKLICSNVPKVIVKNEPGVNVTKVLTQKTVEKINPGIVSSELVCSKVPKMVVKNEPDFNVTKVLKINEMVPKGNVSFDAIQNKDKNTEENMKIKLPDETVSKIVLQSSQKLSECAETSVGRFNKNQSSKKESVSHSNIDPFSNSTVSVTSVKSTCDKLDENISDSHFSPIIVGVSCTKVSERELANSEVPKNVIKFPNASNITVISKKVSQKDGNEIKRDNPNVVLKELENKLSIENSESRPLKVNLSNALQSQNLPKLPDGLQISVNDTSKSNCSKSEKNIAGSPNNYPFLNSSLSVSVVSSKTSEPNTTVRKSSLSASIINIPCDNINQKVADINKPFLSEVVKREIKEEFLNTTKTEVSSDEVIPKVKDLNRNIKLSAVQKDTENNVASGNFKIKSYKENISISNQLKLPPSLQISVHDSDTKSHSNKFEDNTPAHLGMPLPLNASLSVSVVSSAKKLSLNENVEKSELSLDVVDTCKKLERDEEIKTRNLEALQRDTDNVELNSVKIVDSGISVKEHESSKILRVTLKDISQDQKMTKTEFLPASNENVSEKFKRDKILSDQKFSSTDKVQSDCDNVKINLSQKPVKIFGNSFDLQHKNIASPSEHWEHFPSSDSNINKMTVLPSVKILLIDVASRVEKSLSKYTRKETNIGINKFKRKLSSELSDVLQSKNTCKTDNKIRNNFTTPEEIDIDHLNNNAVVSDCLSEIVGLVESNLIKSDYQQHALSDPLPDSGSWCPVPCDKASLSEEGILSFHRGNANIGDNSIVTFETPLKKEGDSSSKLFNILTSDSDILFTNHTHTGTELNKKNLEKVCELKQNLAEEDEQDFLHSEIDYNKDMPGKSDVLYEMSPYFDYESDGNTADSFRHATDGGLNNTLLKQTLTDQVTSPKLSLKRNRTELTPEKTSDEKSGNEQSANGIKRIKLDPPEVLELSDDSSSAATTSFFESSKQKNREKFMQLLEYSKNLMEKTSIEEKAKIVTKMVQQLNSADSFYVGSGEFSALLDTSFHKMSDDKDSIFIVLYDIKKVLKAHKCKLKSSRKGSTTDCVAGSLSSRKSSISEDERSLSSSAIESRQTVNRPLNFEMTDDSISRDKFAEEKSSDSLSVNSVFSSVLIQRISTKAKARKTFHSDHINKPSEKIFNGLATVTNSDNNQKVSFIDNNIKNSASDLKISSDTKSVSKDFSIEKKISSVAQSVSKDNVMEKLSDATTKAVSKINFTESQFSSSLQSEKSVTADISESKFGSSSIASALGLKPIQKNSEYSDNGCSSEKKSNFSSGASTSGLQSSTPENSDPPSKSAPHSSVSEIYKISTAKSPNSIHSPTSPHVSSSDERYKKARTLEDDRNASRIRKLEKALAELDKAIKKCQKKELSLDDLDKEDSAYVKESLYKKRFTQVYKKLCQLKRTTSRTGRYIEKKFNYEGSRYKVFNEAIRKLINKKKAHEKFPDYVEVLNCLKKVNEVHDVGLSEREISKEAERVFKDVGMELQARRCRDEEYSLGCYLTDDIKPEDDPAEHDENLRKTLEENSKKFEASLAELIDEYVDKQKEGPVNSEDGNVEKEEENGEEEEENGEEEEEDEDDEGEKAKELEIDDDLPLTDPASPGSDEPAASKKDDNDDIIIISNESDKSTDPNEELFDQKSTVKKEPETQVSRQFVSGGGSVIEDIIIEDSESSGDLTPIEDLLGS